MEKKVFINRTLNNTEDTLISKNCHSKMIIIIYYDNQENVIDFFIKENKIFKNAAFAITSEHSEDCSSNYIKMDSKCPWWLQGKHYALLELDEANEHTESFDVILRANNQMNNKTLIGFKMELLEWIIDDNKNEFHKWYTLCGDNTYSLYSSFKIGTFAKVSNGWKFYPIMKEENDEVNYI